ncbi:hypothetical protein [Atlantibacter hermannii]|uniref:hypothetical protein n=1 Tax=Atlantibacter hermannii TaxID=565 RepID=UPI0028AEDA91|nr:hypothetical protein [Atlantibacter hermannii]
MKDMTHEQLIRATYVAAKYENPKTAQLLTELAGRLDCALVAARTACLERDASVRAEIEWEKAMMLAVGEDGVGDVVTVIEQLKSDLTAMASENLTLKEATKNGVIEPHQMTSRGVSIGVKNVIVNREIKTPATDAFLAEVRAQARMEGINFAASRLAAAYNHGFVDKPLAEVGDVVRMILDAKSELATATIPSPDGLSGEYAEQALNDWAAQLRGEKTA